MKHLWWGVCLTARQAHQHQPDEAAGGDKEEGDDDRFHLMLQSVGNEAQRDADDTGDESGCQPNPPNLLVRVTKWSNLVHHHTHVSIYHPLEKDCHGSRWLGCLTFGMLYAKQARRTSVFESISWIPFRNLVLAMADEGAGG